MSLPLRRRRSSPLQGLFPAGPPAPRDTCGHWQFRSGCQAPEDKRRRQLAASIICQLGAVTNSFCPIRIGGKARAACMQESKVTHWPRVCKCTMQASLNRQHSRDSGPGPGRKGAGRRCLAYGSDRVAAPREHGWGTALRVGRACDARCLQDNTQHATCWLEGKKLLYA